MRVRLSINLFLIYTAVPLSGLKSCPNQHCVRHCPATHTGKALRPKCLHPGALAQESMGTPAIPDSKDSQEFNPVPVTAEMSICKMPGLNKHCCKFRSFLWLPYVKHCLRSCKFPGSWYPGRKNLRMLRISKMFSKVIKMQMRHSKGNHADKKSIKIH